MVQYFHQLSRGVIFSTVDLLMGFLQCLTGCSYSSIGAWLLDGYMSVNHGSWTVSISDNAKVMLLIQF